MNRIKTLPNNFEELTIEQLQELLANFNKSCTKAIKTIIERIKTLQQAKKKTVKISDSVKDAMSDLIPNDEYFLQTNDEEKNKKREAEINKRLSKLSDKQIQTIIDRTKIYENDFQVSFFKKFADQIVKHNLHSYMKVTFIDEDNKVCIRYYKIEPMIIKRLLDFYSDDEYLIAPSGSDKQDLYIIAFAVRAEIIKNVDEKEQEKIEQRIQIQKEYNRVKRKGAYFNFLNKTCLDLSRYQIGTTYDEHLKLSKTNCFIHCVKNCGKYDTDHINHIVSQLNEEIFHFSVSNLKNIQGLGKLQINVYTDEDQPNYVKYNMNKGDEAEIVFGLYKEHFFIEEDLPITKYWIEHYNEFKNMKKYLEQTNTSQVRGNSLRQSNSTLRTGQVLKALMKNDLFEEIKELNRFNFSKQSKEFVCAPENAEVFCAEDSEEKVKKDKIFNKIFFADFESFTVDSNNINKQHEAFLLCFNHFDPVTNELTQPRNGRNIFSLMNYIERLTEEIKNEDVDENENDDIKFPSFLVYFHNLSYDAAFIIKEQLCIQDFLMVDGNILQFKVNYKGKCDVVFRDSNRIFAEKLINLPKMFLSKEEQQTIFKEIFPYQYYNKQNYIKNVGSIDDAFKAVHNETKEDFVQSLQKANALIDENTFDLQRYALYYCNQDIIVLSRCVLRFREMLLDEFDLELFNYISISSLSLEYQKKKGAFVQCLKVNGLLRQYFQQFIVGGRVMVRDNQKIRLDQCKISDFDAVSLYPSAQKRLYYPTGKCQTLTEEQIQYYNNPENLFKITEAQDSLDQSTLYLQVQIRIPAEGFVKRSFPLLSSRNEDGIRIFSNDVKQECYYVNHIDLQDLITFQGYEYQILSGVCFGGRNYKIQEIISEMFSQRVKYKQLKNACQIIYKLMLNSSYGKTCEGIHNIMYKILEEREFKDYIFKNYNVINDIEKIGEKYFVKENVETNCEEAYTYIGSFILSMSKRIMNEVMCLAEDNGIPIYITDTDSMHLQTDDIQKLGQLFKAKYNRELIGTNQGQFHSDFDSDKGEVQYADACVFLGKKFYIDRLLLTDGSYDYHIRGKGLSKNCIVYKAQELGITVLELYQRLFEGEEMEFDLCSNHAVKFDKKGFSYITKESFKRKVSFGPRPDEVK